MPFTSRTNRIARFLIAALEDRIKLLETKYPSVSPDIISSLVDLDPTGGSLLEWLVRQVKSGTFRHPEDDFRMVPALDTFLKLKKSPRLLKEHGVSPDINRLSFHDLESIHDRIYGTELKTQRQTIEEAKSEGAKTIYDTSPYKIIQIGGPGTDLDLAAQAACTYAKETKWCTSNPEVAKRTYLSKGPLYVIFQDGIKIAQTDGNQVMNLRDRKIRIEKAPRLYRLLRDVGIISSAKYALLYANYILKAPFPAGESAIAQSPKYAYQYAKLVLKAPFPAGEPAIVKSPAFSFFYAQDILKAPFPAGESAIAQSPMFALYYAQDILKSRFPTGEPTIVQDPDSAYFYAKNVLHAPWPEAEPAIAQSFVDSYLYALHVLKAPFPAGEPAIAKDPNYRREYQNLFPSRNLPS